MSTPNTRRQGRLQLAGNVPNQKRNRSSLIRSLRAFQRTHEQQALLAAKIADAIEGLGFEALSSGGPEIRKLLSQAIGLGCGVCGRDDVGHALRRLVGADDDYIADQVIRVGRSVEDVRAQRSPITQSATPSPDFSTPTISPDGKIDWCREPIDDRERKIRASVIRQVETKKTLAPIFMVTDLEALNSQRWTREPASDLSAAIEKWRDLSDKQAACKRREQDAQMLAAAIVDIEGGDLESRGVAVLAHRRVSAAEPEIV